MNKQEFAEVLGLTERQVTRLLAEGTIPDEGKGGFGLGHVRAYVLHLRRGEGVQEARGRRTSRARLIVGLGRLRG